MSDDSTVVVVRHIGFDAVCPLVHRIAQLLWGNPGIVDRTGKPLRVRTLARAGISIVGQLRTRAGFVDTDTLKRRFPLARRGGSLVRVIDSIHAAIPRRWLELPIRRPSERSELLPCLFRDSDCPCLLSGQSSRDVYLNLVHRLYRTPAAIRCHRVETPPCENSPGGFTLESYLSRRLGSSVKSPSGENILECGLRPQE